MKPTEDVTIANNIQTMNTLPIKLRNEPLIEAIFEIRFESSSSDAGSILPGLLFRNISTVEKIEGLPIAQIPKEIRDNDPNLRFAPINKLNCSDFVVNVGDRSVSILFNYTYPGWNDFKGKIIEVMMILSDANIITTVERYSLRYINLLPADSIQEQISLVNLDVMVANRKLEKEIFQIRMEILQNDFIHVIQMKSSAFAVLPNNVEKKGLIADIDTIADQPNIEFQKLLKEFPSKLDLIHQSTKNIFFDCLKPETIERLKPEYDQR